MIDYSPNEEKILSKGSPITDLALLYADSEVPAGWTVIAKPFQFGSSALLYLNRFATPPIFPQSLVVIP